MPNSKRPTDKVPARTILAIVGSGMICFCSILLETSMNVTFPTLMKQFNETIGVVQWLTTGYLLVSALFMTLSSFALKRFSSKKVFSFAMTLFIISLLTCALAPTFPILLTGRIMGGISTGLSMSLMFNIISTEIPLSKLGFYTAIGSIIIAMAPTIGPTYSGIIIYYLGWRMIFWIVLPISIIGGIIGIFNIRSSKEDKKIALDWLGFIWIAGTFILILLAFNNASQRGWTGSFWLLLVLGLVCLGLYIWHALRTKNPLISLKIFKYKTCTLSLISFSLCQFINLGTTFLLPNYAQLVLAGTSVVSGMILLPGSLLRVITMPFSGRLLDKRGAALPILSGASCTLLALLLFGVFQPALTILMMAGFFMIYSLGFSLTYSNILANGMQQLPAWLKVDGNAAFNSIQQYSGSLGNLVMATLISVATIDHQNLSTQAATSLGSHHDFILLTIIAISMLTIQIINFHLQKTIAPVDQEALHKEEA